jgi:DNA-binding CsgD family transcriptional regulator
VAELDRLLRGGLEAIRPDLTFGPVSASLAMAAAESASQRHARILYDGMLPYADQWAATGGAVVLGPFALHLGRLALVLGRSADAHELLGVAVESARAGDCTPWLARCELAVAELHASTARSPSTVRRHARAAHALADKCGLREVAARAGRLHGQAPRPAGLTAREADVLREMATGATNHDIADRLHLSVKTVERHLLNAYRKAGVRNRAEAAAFVTRELG